MKRIAVFLLLACSIFVLVACGGQSSKMLDENDIEHIEACTSSNLWERVDHFQNVHDMIIELIVEVEEGSTKGQDKAVQRIEEYVDDLERQIKDMIKCMESIRETMGFSN